MSGVRSFRDLEVYQRAYQISLAVHNATLDYPRVEQYVLADQLRCASKSIFGNIAEGFGKQRASSAEFRRFLSIAIGCSDEMKAYLSPCLRPSSELTHTTDTASSRRPACASFAVVGRRGFR